MSTDEHDALRRAVDEAARPVIDDGLRMVRQMYEALGGADGLARITAAIDARDAERTAWEAEHPGIRYGQRCHCWCLRQGHDGGVCDGDAATFDVRTLYGRPVQVFFCRPCADLQRR